jgi:hypothetical protein
MEKNGERDGEMKNCNDDALIKKFFMGKNG